MDTEAKQDFRDRLRFIINKKFGNQKNFAEKFNIKRNTLSNYITGRTEPDIDTLILFSSYLNESLDWLLTGKVESPRVSSYFNLELWDQVVNACIIFSKNNNIKLTGRFLLGIYQSLIENKEKNNNITAEEILEKNKYLIII